MAQLVGLFRQGNQLLVPRPYGQMGYYVRPIANDDSYRQLAMNLMGFHSQVCESKIVASNPTVNMRAGDDTPQAIAAAQACRPTVDYYENEWYTSKFVRREAIDLLTNGMFIHRVRWNPFKGGQMVQERQVNQVEKQTDEGYGECPYCQFQGSASDFPNEACPECQTPADVKPPTLINLNQISMGASRPVGEPEIIRCPFPAWRWDLSKDLEDSSWAIYRQRINQGVINLMLGDVIIPDSNSSDDRGLEVLHALAYAGQAFEGKANQQGGSRQNDRRPTMAEFWMSPEDYADIDIEEGETISGQTLPAGKMGKFFKDPMCFVGLNDMQVIVGVYTNESQKSEVVTGQWIMQSDSGAGRGLQDSAAVQRRFNAVDGQVYQGLAAVATPAAITDLSILRDNQGDYLFRPGVNVDVNLAMLPPGTRLQDAFYMPQAGNVSMQYMQYGSVFLKQMFQLTSFVTEFGDNGLIGVDNRTATGAQITAALANSLFGPMLATKGQSRVRIAQMIVSLEAAHNVSSRYFPGKGNARGQMVSGQDLKGKVVFELVQDSELPSTPFSRQTDVRAMIESLGGPQGIVMLKQQEPEMFKQFAAPFNYKPEVDSQDEISTLCLSRVEQFQQNLQAGVADPQMLVEGLRPPVSVYERKQKEKATWFSTWLDLKQGLEAPPEIRAACEQMVVLHITYNTKFKGLETTGEGLIQGAGMAASQAPSALGAMLLQSEGAGEQDPAQEQQNEHEHDATITAMEQQQELRMKQLEGQNQLAVTNAQGRNQLENTKLAGENAIKLEKSKPKPVVRPAAKAS